ncbi:hypothetical protein ACFZC3_15145 [Streptomyces sp. NPDC007903]|uniref:hypothetical protein n=1 Tax=Streptomyces sp. NPDC007903 TaxID=3364786 RepID=UPI0036E51E66
MRSSIPHPPAALGGSTPVREEPARADAAELRNLLGAIRDALDVPHGFRREALLDSRISTVRAALDEVLDGRPIFGIAYEAALIRQSIAEDGGSRA